MAKSGIHFEFTVIPGEVQFSKMFGRFAEDIGDLTKPFKAIAKDFFEGEEKQFSSAGAFGSGGWAPLKSLYADWKERNYPGKPVLTRTGRLASAMSGKSGQSIKEIDRLTAAFGGSVPYGMYHQTGTANMPARKPIQITEEQKRMWMKEIDMYIHYSMMKRFK